MPTLIIPDVHNKWLRMESHVTDIIETKSIDRVVFVGDLVNDWGSHPADEIESMEGLVSWVGKARKSISVDVLLGNHDLPYFISDDAHATMVIRYSPGFISINRRGVGEMIRSLDPLLATTVETQEGTAVISHAGLSSGWLSWIMGAPARTFTIPQCVEAVNSLLQGDQWNTLIMCGPERGGTDAYSSVLWCGMNELIISNPLEHQIVGHTPVSRIDTRTSSNGGQVTFVDTWSTYQNGNHIGNCDFLIIE